MIAIAAALVAVIGAGTYRSLFPPAPNAAQIAVASFSLDKTPATNAEFLAFVSAHPEWQRDRVARVFAETTYLSHWASPTSLGQVKPDQPVVNVSWFAARAYCASRAMRLPTEAEWEHAAAASDTSADGSSDSVWRGEILSLYSRPSPAVLPSVGGKPNFWGVSDLHGVVWEWVLDFTNAMSAIAGADGMRFCGATAAGATDASDFAAFERVAFRSSLKASYAVRNLGFRCAK
jgi:formylglycine-generating enzyme required for sulfatase activity